jgi:hypothetical protein
VKGAFQRTELALAGDICEGEKAHDRLVAASDDDFFADGGLFDEAGEVSFGVVNGEDGQVSWRIQRRLRGVGLADRLGRRPTRTCDRCGSLVLLKDRIGVPRSADCARNDPFRFVLVGEEELFELGILGGDGHGEFGLVEVAGEAFGEWGGLADGFFDYVGEFGWVGGGED